jgi:NADPH2:quinone reductase
VRDLIGERAVDIVLDPVGGDAMTGSLRSLAPEGRLVVVGFTAGEIPTVKVNRLLLGNTGLLGAASRSSSTSCQQH